MLKKVLSLVLCICMFTALVPFVASAASEVSTFDITVPLPVGGEKPVNSATLANTSSTEIVKVEWTGTFASDGTFIDGRSYTVRVTVRIKEGQDKIIKFFKPTTKINGVCVNMRELSDDGKQAVITRSLKAGAQVKRFRAGETAKDLSTAKYSELSLNEFEWEVLRLCNIERAKEGLHSLSMNGTLQDVCDIREQELEFKFAHDRPNGEYCYSTVPSTYEWKHLGENIAHGQDTPEKVVTQWMNSPGHRANIMNPDHDYMGVGYNSDDNYWVQFFASSKDITSVSKNVSQEEFTESDLKDVYLTITASNGYMSYMPVSFKSMKEENGKYYPRLDTNNNVSFVKLKDENSVEDNPDYVLTSGNLFEKYIPITHVYGANFFVGYNMKAGETHRFTIETEFRNETSGWSPTVATPVKRADYQGHYVKVNYLGTYGTVGEKIAVDQLGIIAKEEYDKVMRGEESKWATAYNLTKDTIVISTEIYDANKNFVRKLSPACVIVATDASGNFITFSKFLDASCTNLFSQIDNFFAPDEDVDISGKAYAFEFDKLMLTSKADAEKLLPPSNVSDYEYITYPELEGNKQYNTNHILDDDEFITPDNVYYQVGVDFKVIDPVVKHEIRDVVSYSYYSHKIDNLITQRNIVTSDGTLYGITSQHEKR